MNLEVGMYVRTKKGCICELININEFREPSMKYGVEADYLNDIMFIGDEDILKASHDIKELIQYGDYVNGFEVIAFYDIDGDGNEYEELGIPIYGDSNLDVISEYRPIHTLDIKSIVTKEQFESMEYKVGE